MIFPSQFLTVSRVSRLLHIMHRTGCIYLMAILKYFLLTHLHSCQSVWSTSRRLWWRRLCYEEWPWCSYTLWRGCDYCSSHCWNYKHTNTNQSNVRCNSVVDFHQLPQLACLDSSTEMWPRFVERNTWKLWLSTFPFTKAKYKHQFSNLLH